MSDQPASPPRKRSLVRKAFFFFLAFAVSLGIGRTFEFLTSESTFEAALRLQQGWFNSVSTMAPLALATNYFGDIWVLASTGRAPVIEAPEIQPASAEDKPEQTEQDGTVQCRLLPLSEQVKPQRMVDPVLEEAADTRDGLCSNLSLSRRYCLDQLGSPTYDQCVAEQREIQEKFERECAGWEAGIQRQLEVQEDLRRRAAEHLESNPPPPVNDRRNIGELLSAPLFALVLTWVRLTAAGGISYFWAVLQLAAGLIGFLALYGPLFGDRERGIYLPRGIGGWAIGVPIGTIVVASATAMILKYLMLLGLYLFCQVTSFAAFCCAATGTVGLCWYWTTKLAEFSTGAALTPSDPD
ncbi:hypothetical protein [Nitratireductor sp. XY-223]|uniref:hypothetical protein n=1 Tax=Nitratireductor sp. XY-223 TaxID=2561926 RepID=UPI0010AA00E4|nr:hypothetical protein [Nitratireductor sp. XY-223]